MYNLWSRVRCLGLEAFLYPFLKERDITADEGFFIRWHRFVFDRFDRILDIRFGQLVTVNGASWAHIAVTSKTVLVKERFDVVLVSDWTRFVDCDVKERGAIVEPQVTCVACTRRDNRL